MDVRTVIKATLAALALAGAMGCADPEPADQGTGGDGMTGAGGTGGAVGTGGGPGVGGTMDGAAGTGLNATGGSMNGGGGGANAMGGSMNMGSAGATGAGGSGTGGTSAGPPSCDSLGWMPGNASLCGASKGKYACAYCSLPGPPTREPDCVSTTAFQSAPVLCVSDCASCN